MSRCNEKKCKFIAYKVLKYVPRIHFTFKWKKNVRNLLKTVANCLDIDLIVSFVTFSKNLILYSSMRIGTKINFRIIFWWFISLKQTICILYNDYSDICTSIAALMFISVQKPRNRKFHSDFLLLNVLTKHSVENRQEIKKITLNLQRVIKKEKTKATSRYSRTNQRTN